MARIKPQLVSDAEIYLLLNAINIKKTHRYILERDLLILDTMEMTGLRRAEMIDNTDYEAFTWIEKNIGDEYDKAILDPWKATAFTAITRKHVFTRIHAYPQESDELARKSLKDGCMDTAFLREHGISIVYTTSSSCYNPDLTKVRENVYLLEGTE